MGTAGTVNIGNNVNFAGDIVGGATIAGTLEITDSGKIEIQTDFLGDPIITRMDKHLTIIGRQVIIEGESFYTDYRTRIQNSGAGNLISFDSAYYGTTPPTFGDESGFSGLGKFILRHSRPEIGGERIHLAYEDGIELNGIEINRDNDKVHLGHIPANKESTIVIDTENNEIELNGKFVDEFEIDGDLEVKGNALVNALKLETMALADITTYEQEGTMIILEEAGVSTDLRIYSGGSWRIIHSW